MSERELYIVEKMRPCAYCAAPWGIYHTNCQSPQPYDYAYTYEDAVMIAQRMNAEVYHIHEIYNNIHRGRA